MKRLIVIVAISFGFICAQATYAQSIHELVAQGNEVAVAALLMENNNLVNLQDADGYTPLHVACLTSQTKIAKLLITYGANVNAIAFKNGATPIYCAAQNGENEIVKLLADAGADLDKKVGGYSPLEIAVIGEHIDTKEVLISKGAKIQPRPGETELHIAARVGNIKAVTKLINSNVDITRQDNEGETPFHEAAKYGHSEIVNIFISKKIRIDDTDNYGNTALIFAAGFGDIGTVRVLLKNGANPSLKNRAGWTPLHFAAMGGFNDVVKELIARKVDVNAKDNMGGGTPLFYANQKKHFDTVHLLQRYGAKE